MQSPAFSIAQAFSSQLQSTPFASYLTTCCPWVLTMTDQSLILPRHFIPSFFLFEFYFVASSAHLSILLLPLDLNSPLYVYYYEWSEAFPCALQLVLHQHPPMLVALVDKLFQFQSDHRFVYQVDVGRDLVFDSNRVYLALIQSPPFRHPTQHHSHSNLSLEFSFLPISFWEKNLTPRLEWAEQFPPPSSQHSILNLTSVKSYKLLVLE